MRKERNELPGFVTDLDAGIRQIVHEELDPVLDALDRLTEKVDAIHERMTISAQELPENTPHDNILPC